MNRHRGPQAGYGDPVSAAGGISASFAGRIERQLRRLAWYGYRFASMDASEIAHRVAELGKRHASRRRKHDWNWARVGDGPLPGLPIDVDRLRRASDALGPLLGRSVQGILDQPLRRLDRTWPNVSAEAIWHVDPCTGALWPRERFCFDIPYRGGSPLGDVKYVWELNRLQHLQPVAALAFLKREACLLQYCVTEIESWIDCNPPYKGINWRSGIELALRAVSILFVAGLLDPMQLPSEWRAKVRACLNAHGYWLARFPSLHSSANNHLVAEAGGLFLIGTLASDLPHSATWAGYGRKVLTEEVERQIHPDGVGAEQSPTYTAFTLEWYLLCLQVADRKGAPFPDAVRRRLELAAEHLRWLTDDAGNQPRIGDDDEGRVLVSGTDRETQYVASVLACLSGALGRPDVAPPIALNDLRSAILGGSTTPSRPLRGLRTFAPGGYSIAALNMNRRSVHLVLDHGPLGYLSIAAHGHADALAIWLSVAGRQVFVDAGTYQYHGGGIWRDHFRSTPAHNTLCINGSSSSRMVGPFNWRRKASTRLRLSEHVGDVITFIGETDGFLHDMGVVHERTIAIAGDAINVIDRLVGRAKRELRPEVGFLLDPSLEVANDDARGCIVIADEHQALLEMRVSKGALALCQSGQIEPMRGWHSGAFGKRRPTNRLTFQWPATIPKHSRLDASICVSIRVING